MEKPVIKNIFWDVDGVLADLGFAYFNFLKNHPNYKDKYSNIEWEDLPKVLPFMSSKGLFGNLVAAILAGIIVIILLILFSVVWLYSVIF